MGMKRKWDGDTYAALRDCLTALSLDPGHIKAHLRLAQCLTDLEWLSEADTCLDNFKLKHPEHKKSAACTQLERDLNTAKEKSASAKTGASSSTAPAAPTPVLSQYSAASFLRPDDADGDEVMDSDDDSDETTDETPAGNASHPGGISSRLGHISSDHSKQETAGRLKARDYSARFLGACNTTTDIKEANFLGRNGQFIMAGSDDGKFFIWDRKTTNIVRVLMGDEAIVNCLQGHPTAPILATSGIDPVVRIWQPRPEDGEENTRVVEDLEAAAFTGNFPISKRKLKLSLYRVCRMSTSVIIRTYLQVRGSKFIVSDFLTLLRCLSTLPGPLPPRPSGPSPTPLGSQDHHAPVSPSQRSVPTVPSLLLVCSLVLCGSWSTLRATRIGIKEWIVTLLWTFVVKFNRIKCS